MTEPRDKTAKRKRSKELMRDRTHELGGRVKELSCLLEISKLVQRPDISLEEILQGTVNLIPPGWQDPEVTCARIVFEGQEFRTENFRETAWKQTSDLIVNGERSGAVEVCYLQKKPEADEGPFLKEERDLINAIAERLGRISERRRAEEALRESEARYKALFAGAPEGMIVADLHTKQFRHANPAMCRMFGYTEEELLRIGVADIHPKESLSHVLAEFEAQARGEKPSSPDIPCRRKDGSLFYANVSAIMVALDGRRCNVGFFTDVTERRRDERLLRDGEERFRSVLEVSRDLIYRLNLQTRTYEYVSPSVRRLVGFAPQEIVAMGIEGVRERFHPEDRERLGTHPSRLPDDTVEDRKAPTIEYRWHCKDGEYRWLSDNRAFVLDKDGRALALVGTVRDITEDKQAEEALRESEERFRSLSASAPIGIFLTDANGKVIYANELLQEISGLASDESAGSQWTRVIHPDDREALLQGQAKAVAEGGEFTYEFRIVTPQGETRWVHVHTAPTLSEESEQSGRVGTLEDITERKQAESALRESEEKYRDLFENASDLIQSAAADGPFVYVNPAWRETLGYSEEEIGGLSFMDIIHPDSKAHCAELFERVMAGECVDHIEAMFVTKEGKTIAVEGSASGAVKDGEIVGTRGIFRDISERQRAEEERRKAYESIVFLLATAAEARDPYTEDHLPRIRGFAEAIAAELGLPPDEIREIGLSSLLHDLGKMRVPDSIITKPGPLSAAEWKIMKQHPLWGEELLAPHPWLETARQIARWHHERWDGGGYPDGLRGEEIPLCAAIVTVADALDAMTSDRPYKKAWPPRRAIKEVRAQKGRQFSPDVVEAFNRALRKGAIKRVAVESLRISELSRAA